MPFVGWFPCWATSYVRMLMKSMHRSGKIEDVQQRALQDARKRLS